MRGSPPQVGQVVPPLDSRKMSPSLGVAAAVGAHDSDELPERSQSVLMR
jgi:hypothetical protein